MPITGCAASAFVRRLKTRPQFQAVLAGAVIAKTSHFALHRCVEFPSAALATPVEPSLTTLFPVEAIWLGAMVPKRWARRAVTRNAIKRQIYTVAVDFFDRLPAAAFVIRLRRDFARSSFASATSDQLKVAVRSELRALFESAVSAP